MKVDILPESKEQVVIIEATDHWSWTTNKWGESGVVPSSCHLQPCSAFWLDGRSALEIIQNREKLLPTTIRLWIQDQKQPLGKFYKSIGNFYIRWRKTNFVRVSAEQLKFAGKGASQFAKFQIIPILFESGYKIRIDLSSGSKAKSSLWYGMVNVL